jgi:DNA-binding PadR family transcriptional regulator
MKELSKAEEIFLLSIWRLKENAYGVTIKRKVKEATGYDYAYGTLYGLLDQLDRKRYVIKRTGDPTTERGGRRKILYTLTQTGIDALKASIELHKTVWDGITEYSFEERQGS